MSLSVNVNRGFTAPVCGGISVIDISAYIIYARIDVLGIPIKMVAVREQASAFRGQREEKVVAPADGGKTTKCCGIKILFMVLMPVCDL